MSLRRSDSHFMDEFHDSLVRMLVPKLAYETATGAVLYVLAVDRGSEPGEFPAGRRPAQAKVLVLESGAGHQEGAVKWIDGRSLELLAMKAVG